MDVHRENTDVRWVGFHPLYFLHPKKHSSLFCFVVSSEDIFFWQNLLQLFDLLQQQLLLFVEEILFGLEQLALIVATMAVAVTMTDSSMVVLVFKRNLMVHVWKLFFSERGNVVR